VTVIEVAKACGVDGKKARRVARRLGIVVQDRTGYTPLSGVDAQRLTDVCSGHLSIDDPSAPGLPLSALGDPAMREAFTRLRFEREHRLQDMLSASRLWSD
jgi:hypothetical protein